MTGFIRTIGGDLPADLAGPTYVHEHLIIDSPLVAETMSHIHLPSVDEAVAEVKTCIAAGVRMMVDAMPAGSGRDPERLSRVSVLTGMRVVAATGLHTAKYYDDVDWAREEGPEQLAVRFVADIVEGIDKNDYLGPSIERTPVTAGVVKVAALGEKLTLSEARLFEAAAMTTARTGVPVLTHTEGGRGGPPQIETLLGLGLAPEEIALSHTDKIDDRAYHQDMLATGVFLSYDQALRDPETTFGLIENMTESGYSGQLLLGTDGARRSLWSTLGGSPGLASLYRSVSDLLGQDLSAALFEANPRRYLTLSR